MQLLGNSNPFTGAGERLVDTATDIGGGLNTIATSNQEDARDNQVWEGIGETALSAVTLGRAHENRAKWQAQGDNEETIEERNEERENADGFLEEAGAFNEDLKTGLDVFLDNPEVNVQDAGSDVASTVTGAEDDEDLGTDLAELHTGYEDAQEPLADAYKPKIEAGFDAAGLDAPNAETVLQEAPGTAAEWIAELPAEAVVTAGTGIDPETGETDADPAPLDLADAALVGGGKALKVGAKASKAASSAKILDDISAPTADGLSTSLTRGVDNAVASGVSDGLTSGLSGAIVGGATALGGARAGKTMARGLSKVGDVLNRVSRGGGSAADDVASNTGRTADEGITIEPEGVGLADESTESAARSVGDSGSLFDEGVTIEQSVDDTVSSVTDDAGLWADDAASGADDAASGTDDAGIWADDATGADEVSGANDGSDLLGGADESVDNAVDDALGGVDDTVTSATDDISTAGRFDEFAAGDGLLNRAWRPFNNGLNRVFGSTVRASDDGITGADDAASAADDVATGADDTTSILGRLGSGVGGTLRAASRGIGSTGRLITYGIGASLIAAFAGDALGVELFGDSGDKQGVTNTENYKQYFAKTYTDTQASLLEIFERTGDGEELLGYTILLGTDKQGRFIGEGNVAVLSTAGEPIEAQPLEEGDEGNSVFKPRFDTTEAADKAHAAFVEKLRNEGYTDEDQDAPAPAEGIKGSLEAPSEIAVGEAFTANWEVSTDGQFEAAGRLVLAFQTPTGLWTLAETRYSLGANSASQSGTFQTPNGWSGLDAGSHTLYAISTGENRGVVAKDSVEITNDESAPDRSSDSSPSDEDSTGGTWGDPEIVQELPEGWYLMAQPRTDAPEQVRFLIAGKRSDGDEIYVHPDGRAKTEAHTYPTAEKASAAFQKWMKRFENGQTRASEEPSEDADRPSQNAVTRDAKKGSGGASGSLQRAKQAASENPMKAAAAVAGTAIFGYYLYKNGYLDEPIGWIKAAIPNGVIPS